MNKTLKELNLEDDFLFAKVMSDKAICKELLEKILEIEIEKVEIVEEQKTIDLLLESKGIRLDVYVKDENNTIYNVEMQRGKHKNLPKRLRYYQGSIDLDLISKGEDYRKLTKSYIIFVCTFDLFNKGRHKYTFQNLCLEDNSIMLNDEAQKIVLNTKGIMNDLSEELLEFLEYVEESTDGIAKRAKGNLVKSIHKRVLEVKNDISVEVHFLKKCEAQSRSYMTLLERDREKIEEGREEGREEAIKQLILKQYSKGLSVEYIADINEIDIEYVRDIVKNNTSKVNN
ncbi:MULTISPECIES: Rpn family recombination-promoting nuclease/putative transposase [Clostridium]|uniref:Transposase n=2 Tax=Clostridium TaxID=1485 RepID=A0A1S9N348_CLOBE|nr:MULTISPECIES: Rpn family recombination-promoting nuclease/putative transposase [Clostridium]MBN7573967.1 Rpn family recombination-promoting nuclease/putative transposase [Clostridium beijerinckii]MBN7577647.1 Rpn family recombination-promoting nuclease/putative transposase [Clostridium beijerinckii]MBN7583717.1 Rpn family recombination-promoting nuclease/putative transposase [Clostridium beijerinckii]MBO0519861.1 Rpn family recombination-promoting nuclease/putative transposase [Clostridium b